MNNATKNGPAGSIKLNPYVFRIALYLQTLMEQGFQGNVLIPIKDKHFGLIKKEEFIDLRSHEPPDSAK